MRYHSENRQWRADIPEELALVDRFNRHDWIRNEDGRPVPDTYDPRQAVVTGLGARVNWHGRQFVYIGNRGAWFLFEYQNAEPREVAIPDAPELDMSSLLDRATPLPPFKIVYDTMEEARLRLNNTVVLLKSKPFLVEMVGGNDKKVMLLLADGAGKRHKIALENIPDLRSPPPRYVTSDGHAYYLCRVPARVYQQGLNQNNTYVKLCGSTNIQALERRSLLNALEDRRVLPWSEAFSGLIKDGHVRDLRLSGAIAVYKQKARVVAEYKGRDLGQIKDDTVIFNFNDDNDCPWITNALREVSLKAIPHAG